MRVDVPPASTAPPRDPPVRTPAPEGIGELTLGCRIGRVPECSVWAHHVVDLQSTRISERVEGADRRVVMSMNLATQASGLLTSSTRILGEAWV